MNIANATKIIEESELSDQIKDVIYSLLPVAENNENVKSLILGLMDHEAQLADLDADEAEELASEFKDAIEKLDNLDNSMDKRTDEIVDGLKSKIEALSQGKNEVSNTHKLEEVRQQMVDVTATPQMPAVQPETPVVPMSVTDSSMPSKPEPVPTL